MVTVIAKRQNILFTYLLTPWSIVLLEKLTGSAASQEIPRIFGTRRFITVLTSAPPPPVPILSQLHPVLTTPITGPQVLKEYVLHK